MNIEIADRLVKLRKKNGYSQEELADRLGLSRQAVSKWERAEASPDTDNLICLAKLYNVSIDDLLKTEEDVETIVDEQVKAEEPKEEEKEAENPNPEKESSDESKKDKPKGDKIDIGPSGIHVIDEDGSEIHVGCGGIHITDTGCKTEKKHHCCEAEHFLKDKGGKISGIVLSVLMLLAVVAYILLGSLANMWFNAWIVFFIPEIIASLIRAIASRKFCKFNISFVSVFVFFFVCLVIPGTSAMLWHPMWTVFLAIPIYYIIFGPIDAALEHKRCQSDIKITVDADAFDNEDEKDDEDDK
ncbi:MAG TPA: helix-turn-helix transcriptional regulator [Bacilli bacterium]|nr:helix-turn-helix transcriptional regulator [Bacilli bacterium]HPS18508.1 helix-turn-helix transcriptional regulator [Bacilli bacterium]